MPSSVRYSMGTGAKEPPTQHPPAMTTATPFKVGQTYYGSLACAHSSFPVICIKRTEKSVWFEHATLPHAYSVARSKARPYNDGIETANFHGWYVMSTSTKDNGWDMMTA